MMRKIKMALISFIFFSGCSGKMPELGVNNGLLIECPPTPNCVNSQAGDGDHLILPLLFIGTPKEAQTRLVEILEELKHAKIVVLEDNYIRAEFASRVFRFIDDVEFYFPETGRRETVIQLRSASRMGYSDFEVNRKRIERIRSLLE